jgi:hypothetical protein
MLDTDLNKVGGPVELVVDFDGTNHHFKLIDEDSQGLFIINGMLGYYGGSSYSVLQDGLILTFPEAISVSIVETGTRKLAVSTTNEMEWIGFSLSFDSLDTVSNALTDFSSQETTLSLCDTIENPCNNGIIINELIASLSTDLSGINAPTYAISSSFQSSLQSHFIESGTISDTTNLSKLLTAAVFIALASISTTILFFIFLICFAIRRKCKPSVQKNKGVISKEIKVVDVSNIDADAKNVENGMIDIPLSPLTSCPTPKFFGQERGELSTPTTSPHNVITSSMHEKSPCDIPTNRPHFNHRQSCTVSIVSDVSFRVTNSEDTSMEGKIGQI